MATIEERVSYVEGRLDSSATKEDLADMKGELKSEMATMRGELQGEMATMRGEMASLRSELKGEMASLKSDVMAIIAKAEVRITRWTIGTLIASVAVIAAIAIAI